MMNWRSPMSDRKKDLIALREKVRAKGRWCMPNFKPIEGVPDNTLIQAISGALDAALALLEATLPGWAFGVIGPRSNDKFEAMVIQRQDEPDYFEASAATPALALVLAILEALIEREDDE